MWTLVALRFDLSTGTVPVEVPIRAHNAGLGLLNEITYVYIKLSCLLAESITVYYGSCFSVR